MLLKMENSQNPIQKENIEKFEKRYEINLPEDYKNFLLKYNGGKPTLRRFVTIDGKTKSSIMLFLPLADIESPNLKHNFLIYNRGNRLPKNLLPIGEDPIKNQICISISENDYGYIYYWNLDFEEENSVPSYQNISLIAKTFSDFIENLQMPK